ncbi:ABC transporter ATP-binding protein [Kibdelosporangium phytohabitans]|uniref:ABC transporter ATP-binding protein n=1 Tax=Kibdelosporangium phytohabitans TaxID=860235 RepID=A0A0N9I2K9_9PSEU|nr:ABC transporter ATP-binding protein [Kibdelosporangium phytohabitans]ALG09920.1 ABC transporter ATP-binding protein [Kibdelosporangium phytohabitans]MBE1468674.1 ABC-type dipeptide/oligopeptide/nickel transport system ATPase component [Kibdelosporangium phytohabitans]
MALLEITDLTVHIGQKKVLDGISLDLDAGQRLGVIGESGSGKSMTALAILGLLPDNATVTGSVRLDGTELTGLGDKALAGIRGTRMAMVFQEPLSALNPLMRVGRQIAEPLRLHHGYSKGKALAEAVALAAKVGLPDPDRAVRAYPHQLSGGQRQRVGIAIALACRPSLLIADEPTTALDVTVQAEILELLRRLVADEGTALVFITHDLAVLAQMVQRVAVLGSGVLLEQGPLAGLLRSPRHPYTKRLLDLARMESL